MLYIVSFFLLIIMFPKLVIFLGIFQQNHYKVRKYLKNLKKHYLKTYSTYLEYLSLICLSMYYFYNKWYLVILVLFFILGAFMLTEQLIVLPVITSRIKRLLICLTIVGILPYFIYPGHSLLFLLETIFIPFLIIFASIINKPIETLINNKYLNKSSQKLNQIKPFTIGITGSYGKTSTKHYLYQIIKDYYYTYASPNSYNTPMGLSKCINNDLPSLTEVFIAEMGATKKHDIEELVDLVDVKLGIITEIGPQHLETFKTIENILQTKLEIIKSNSLEALIINNDNELLKNYDYPKSLKVITIGINTNAQYQAKNISLTNQGLHFDIYTNGEFFGHINTLILGRHNISNILCALAAAEYLKIPKEHIIKIIKNIEPFKHRLSIERFNHVLVIDDAFNANIVGFKNALEVLKLTNNKKIVITPGIVDAGAKMETLNQEIGSYLVEELDMVYLIQNEASLYIEKYFQKCAFKNYEMVSNFQQAYHQAIKKYQEEVTILIENDLPDNYLRR